MSGMVTCKACGDSGPATLPRCDCRRIHKRTVGHLKRMVRDLREQNRRLRARLTTAGHTNLPAPVEPEETP